MLKNNWDRYSITLIILSIHNLYKFFKVINKKLYNNSINIIYIERFKNQNLKTKENKVKSIIYILTNIIREKQYLKAIHNRNFSKLRGAQVFFSSRHFANYNYFFLKKLYKTNKLVYIPDPAADTLKTSKYAHMNDFINLATLIRSKMTFGWELSMMEYLGEKRFLSINDNFMAKKVYKIITEEERDEMLKGVDWGNFRIFGGDEYEVIYFPNDFKILRLSWCTLVKELTEVFEILTKYISEEKIGIKYHPHHDLDRTIITTGNTIEEFIPAELISNKKPKIYLSIFSTSIVNIENGTAISLIDMVSVRDEKIKREIRDRLMKMSLGKILFPKSIYEFEKLVANLVQKHNRN